MSSPAADLVVVDAQVRTDAAAASAVAVRDGVITAVGTGDVASTWRGPHTEVIDARGATLLPGFVDAHVHPVYGLDFTRGVDLSHCTDVAQLRAAVRQAADEGDGWLLGWGVVPDAFGAEPVTWAALGAGIDRPVMLRMFDGHATVASPEALRRAGVSGARAFRTDARVVCDDAGVPTGHLLEEAAVDLVARVVPAESHAQRVARLAVLLASMASTGLTGGHVMDFVDGTAALLAELEDIGRLPLRLRIAPWLRPEDDADRVNELVAMQGTGGRLWQVAGVKLFLDGTIDGGTSWLREPDTAGRSTRPYWPDPADYSRAVRRLSAAGVPTATHAIGDAAVAHVLDTVQGCSAPRSGRHRIEHLETLPDDLVGRLGGTDVVVSMQPTHATHYIRADLADNWSRLLGARRAGEGWRLRDVVDAGAVLALGSDWPVAPFDPRASMAAAQLRRPAGSPDVPAVSPGQALTARQALDGYTRATAYAEGREHDAGRIAVGARADLTLLGADPLRIPPDELADAPVRLTVVAGRVAHRGD